LIVLAGKHLKDLKCKFKIPEIDCTPQLPFNFCRRMSAQRLAKFDGQNNQEVKNTKLGRFETILLIFFATK